MRAGSLPGTDLSGLLVIPWRTSRILFDCGIKGVMMTQWCAQLFPPVYGRRERVLLLYPMSQSQSITFRD